jgi:MarR family transcriptional regulator, lower aerobic nicotinate degradation pathway regulator
MTAPTETQAPSLPLPELLLSSPVFLMLQLVRLGKKRAEAAPEGPRLPLLMVLACLDEFGPQSQRELCRRLGLDPSDMVGIIDRLETLGHAVRERDAVDRRRHAIAMTDAGRAFLAETSPALSARHAKILPGLTEDERELVTTLLRRALAAQDERVPALTSPRRADHESHGKSE